MTKIKKNSEKPPIETGDDGFYLEETPESQDYSMYANIRILESSNATFEEVLRILSISKEKYEILKKQFEITGED